MLHFVWKCQNKEWRRSILTPAKRPQLIGYHSNVLQLLQKLFQFYNLHTCAYQFCKVGEVWSSTCWDIWYNMSIFAVSSKKGTETPCVIDWHGNVFKGIKTRNAWQSLAYSPLGTVVSPRSEYLWKTLTYWSPECLTAPPHSEHRWTSSTFVFESQC